MLDIPILILAGRHIASIARRKGFRPRHFVWLMIFAWYGGALFGGYSAGVIHKAFGGSASTVDLSTIPGALAGAFTGLGIAYIAVCSRRPLGCREQIFDDYDDEPPPRLFQGNVDYWTGSH